MLGPTGNTLSSNQRGPVKNRVLCENGHSEKLTRLFWLVFGSPITRSMDYIWTPWRYAYITTAAKHDGKPEGCIFCELPKLPDPEAKIVYRGKHCFIILNSFPYTSGHVMVVPFAHMDELQKLPESAAQEMMALSQRMEGILREVYSPDGINLGMNVGRAAGAGIAGHIHMHVLPRWVGDTNFMTVTAESRVLPESLEETYQRIREALAGH